jgi:hypothetical protein
LRFCPALFLFFLWTSFAAAESPVYTVTVQVDVTGPSAAKAKEEALALGQSLAFQKLLKRLSLGDDVRNLPEFTPERVQDYIKSFSVKGEQHSDVQYVAAITFEFDDKKVQTTLETHEIPFLEIGLLRLVVLPIVIKDGQLILWNETENIWYRTWLSLGESHDDTHIVTPLGDLEDQIACPLQDLAHLDMSMLTKLKERYEADDVLLTILSLDKEGQAEEETYRGFIRYIPFAMQDIKNAHGMGPFSLHQTERDTVLEEWRTKIIGELQGQWALMHNDKDQTRHVFKFKLVEDNFTQWHKSLEKIQHLSIVKGVTFHSLSREETILWLSFKGDLQSLKEKLVLEGFSLDDENDLVVISSKKDIHDSLA